MRLFASLMILLFSVGCATVNVPDFYAHITLPASGDGYAVSTISQNRKRIPKEKWEEMRMKGIILMPEDYRKVRKSFVNICNTNKCKQTLGALDDLFITIDDALQAVDRFKKGGP